MSNVKFKVSEATKIVGGLSNPSKMPGKAIGLPAAACPTGARLAAAGIDGPCTDCYAKKNFYAMPGTQNAQAKRLEALQDPRWTDAMIELVRRQDWFRWHDSGDVQNMEHAQNIVHVARSTPDTGHWLPTQEWGIFRKLAKMGKLPQNLLVRFSARKYGDRPRPDVWTHWSSVADASTWEKTRKENASGDMSNGFACPAHDQGNACQDCRACWSPDVNWVVYRKH